MNPIAIRLLSQQLACPQFLTPSEVVSHLCAMQAQDYRMVRWAVLSRTKNASAEAVIKGWMKSNKITIEDKELYSIRAERCAAETFLPCRQLIPWQKTR